jgi:hypothetical protein
MTAAEAAAAGFHQLTSPYSRKTEAALLAAVVADMVRGGIVHELIEESRGHFAVWRKGWVELPDPARTVCAGIRGARV